MKKKFVCGKIAALAICLMTMTACGSSKTTSYNDAESDHAEEEDAKSEKNEEDEDTDDSAKELSAPEQEKDDLYKSIYSKLVEDYYNSHKNEESEYAKLGFDLIYFDNDDIPELVTGLNGYYVDLYTCKDSVAVPIFEEWGYGAGGNAGYQYLPRQGIVSNTNQDYAGLMYYITFWRWDPEIMQLKELEDSSGQVSFIVDSDGDGMYSEAEQDKADFDNPHYFIGDREVSESEFNSKGFEGNFETLCGDKDYREIITLLQTSETAQALSETVVASSESDWRGLYLQEIQDMKEIIKAALKQFNTTYYDSFDVNKDLWFDLIDVDGDGIPELFSFDRGGDIAWMSTACDGSIVRHQLYNTYERHSGTSDYGAYAQAFAGSNRIVKYEMDCDYEIDGGYTDPGSEIIDPDHDYVWFSKMSVYELDVKKNMVLIDTVSCKDKYYVDGNYTCLEAFHGDKSISEEGYFELADQYSSQGGRGTDFGSGQAIGNGVNADYITRLINGDELRFEVMSLYDEQVNLVMSIPFECGNYYMNMNVNDLPGNPKEGSIYSFKNMEWMLISG